MLLASVRSIVGRLLACVEVQCVMRVCGAFMVYEGWRAGAGQASGSIEVSELLLGTTETRHVVAVDTHLSLTLCGGLI